MANYEIPVPTTGAGVQPTAAGAILRSLKKSWRLGNKKYRLFIIVPGGAAISETIVVKNGRKAFCFAINGNATVAPGITVTPTSSGTDTSYAIAESSVNWSASLVGFAVEVTE